MEKASTLIAEQTHESKQDAASDVGMSNTVSDSAPLERGQPTTKQAETQKTGTVAVMRQEQLGVSSSGSKRPSTRPRGGDNREQRPDAALDVLGADSTSTGGAEEAPQ